MLTLDRRPCKIGISINTRTEKHGEDDVPAMDIPLASIMLTGEELNALLGESHAHDALFNFAAGKPPEPLLPTLAGFRVKGKFEESSVDIEVGLKAELISLKNVKLSKVTLEPQTGGLTAMAVTVQCTPELDDGVTHLLAFLNAAAHVSVSFGKSDEAEKTQGNLPLEPEGGKRKSGRPRKSAGADSLN